MPTTIERTSAGISLNPESLSAIQPELGPGERILWANQPKTSTIFHKEDGFLIPFSFMWGGFAIFWEASVAGLWGTKHRPGPVSYFGLLWGVPFVLIGQYLIWGRFFYAAWKKKRTHYGVTDRRVIVVQNGRTRQVSSAFIDTLPVLVKEVGKDGSGTLRFTPAMPSGRSGGASWDAMAVGAIPTFVDIDDLDTVYRLVSDLREKKPSRFSSFSGA
jgi:hypothetical protein